MRRCLELALLLCVACSRTPSDSTAEASSATTAVPASPLPTVSEAPSAISPAPVLTPEDAEEDAAHRITERNLESELDRLEREIQAE